MNHVAALILRLLSGAIIRHDTRPDGSAAGPMLHVWALHALGDAADWYEAP
jgi:hypothetical protein